jgi:uncharacterized protein involved in propanediol utilization
VMPGAQDNNARAIIDDAPRPGAEVWRIADVLVSIGRGVATAHHGELFQGQIREAGGRLTRCLLSLPCTGLYSCVVFHPDDTGTPRVQPPHKKKTRLAIELTLEYLDAAGIGGTAVVESNIKEGKGYGSSTADCVAAVRAVADALGQRLADEEVARLVVRAETASDNTMFAHAVLFAQREAIVVEHYTRPVPHMHVLGIDTDRDGIVDTLDYPPAVYSAYEIQVFHTLVAALRRAIRTQDVSLLGRVATASATVNQKFLPKPLFGEIQRLAEHVGALGVAVAHSGTVVSVLLDPANPRAPTQLATLRHQLGCLGITDSFLFQTRACRLKDAAGARTEVVQ